jgi:hypothetical protein
MRRVWIISDLQVPFHDRKAVDAVAQCIADMKGPDDLVATAGDEMDFQTISRWSQGTALEWERSIGKDRDATVQVLKDLQVQVCVRSNHTDRLFHGLMKRMPGLIGLPELELENFLRLGELGIHFSKAAYPIAPGWNLLHGDEAGVSQVAGQTAAGLVKKVGTSVACGHTHRLGLVPYTTSVNGRVTRTLFGFEVGNLMSLEAAKYTKGIANWQQGFGLLYVDGPRVTPVPIPIEKKSFVVEGVQYKWN